MYRIIYKIFRFGTLHSETAIDRANFEDVTDCLEKIAIDNSNREEWKYTSKKSVSYITDTAKYWHSYKIEEVPDRVLCSAVHFSRSFAYSNGSSRTVEVPMPVNIESGIVVTGRRHSDCYAIYMALTGHNDIKDTVDGFLTVSNKFVDRAEAFQIARLAGQLLSHVDCAGDWLCSEMLYFD